jgi:hypothetical protein
MQSLLMLAKSLKKDIGAHYKLLSRKPGSYTNEQYQELQRKSDEAAALAKYLIQMLDNRHQAVTFAHAIGMPGYINMR